MKMPHNFALHFVEFRRMLYSGFMSQIINSLLADFKAN